MGLTQDQDLPARPATPKQWSFTRPFSLLSRVVKSATKEGNLLDYVLALEVLVFGIGSIINGSLALPCCLIILATLASCVFLRLKKEEEPTKTT